MVFLHTAYKNGYDWRMVNMTLFYPHYPKLMAINIYLLNGHHDLDDFGYRYFRKTTFFL